MSIVQLSVCFETEAGADVMLKMNPDPGIAVFDLVSVEELSHLKLVPDAALPGDNTGGIGEKGEPVVFVNKSCCE